MTTSKTSLRKTPQAPTQKASRFRDFPDEILLLIAEYVWTLGLEEFDIPLLEDMGISESADGSDSGSDCSGLFSTYCKRKYEELTEFCLINQACRRVGQEVLFRNLDLTTDPVEHLVSVLRTLLVDMPDFREKVISIRWKVPPALREEATTIRWKLPPRAGESKPGLCGYASTLKQRRPQSKLIALLPHLEDSTTIEKDLLRRIRAHNIIAWTRVLITSTPNLKKLDATDSTDGDLTQFIKELSSICSLGQLNHLEHVHLRSQSGDRGLIMPLLNHDGLLRLTTRKTLELRPTGSVFKDSYQWAQSTRSLYFASEPPRIYEIHNLILHDQPYLWYEFLMTFKVLRSLTLVSKRYQGFEYLLEIPNSMAWRLEHLRLEFRRGHSRDPPDVGIYFWPYDLSTLTTLKTLHIEGGFFLYHRGWCPQYGDGSFANVCRVASDFFPPNIQELVYLPDKIETARLVEQHQPLEELVKESPGPKVIGNFCIREFLRHEVDTRPALRKVTISSDLSNRLGFGELVDQLAGVGVEMVARSQEGEEKDLDDMYGSLWRDWLAESLGAPVEYESEIYRHYRVNGLGNPHDH